MKKRIKKMKNDHPVGQLKAITDFLPPPEELAPAEEMVKVTLAVDRSCFDFFKSMATKVGGKYQKMMREVLRGYAEHYAGKSH
ncbi:MAG: CopG family transcriptional regulator [Deltaproteobacteria bacterium]|nr:CopG family transcriptional regulator [Deltaproteobacteria bacterium]